MEPKVNDYTQAKYYEDNIDTLKMKPSELDFHYRVCKGRGITPDKFTDPKEREGYIKYLAENK